jgi:D-tyrosyl-tRNA(Tyr) deacylase
MKAVIQRATRACVTVDGDVVGAIERGAVILLGVEKGDGDEDADATATKIAKLRFFPDKTPMDLTLGEVGGSCLVISQFTLAANIKKGNRPSFTAALDPESARALYVRFADHLESLGIPTARGVFGAKMAVELVNDGPVTFLLECRNGRVQ